MAGRRVWLGSLGLLVVLSSGGVGAEERVGAGRAGRAPSARVLASVVQVRVDDGSLAPVVATGWVGPCGLVITVAHALEGHRGVVVGLAGGRFHRAQIVARDDAPDLALLRADGLSAPRLSLSPPGRGPLGIAVLRNPNTPEVLAVQPRRQVAISIDDRSGTHLRDGLEFTPSLIAGDSGAPIFDSRGRVVGVAFATNDTVAYASSTSELRTLLARAAPSCPDR